MSNSEYFLNVQKSLLGNAWRGPTQSQDRVSEQISQIIKIPIQVSKVLARLGVSPNNVENFLLPKIRNLLPDPMQFKDMKKGAIRLIEAIKNRDRVAIFADYDVDGAASAALLINWLKEMGITATLYVPDRVIEGYGLNTQALEKLSMNHELIICVDCGTSSHGPIKNLNGKADLVILDHHIGSEELPDALAIINPNRQDELTDFRYLCAAGVVFLYLVAVTTTLRGQNIKSPDLIQSLDLVALATVADVVPLIGLNRAFVQQGLKVIRNRARPGLKVLADISKINSPVDEYHIGFVLAPKLNAAGRIGDASLATKLLSTNSEIEAQNLAEKLEVLNTERQAIGERVENEALQKLNKECLNTPIIFVSDNNWHPGVIGIVASKIKEKTNRPSFVISFSGGIGKGSGRSIPGVDLGSLMQKLSHEKLIEKGGGHSMAAGITLSKRQLKPAFDRLVQLIELKPIDIAPENDFYIDGILLPRAANLEIIERLAEVGPFGSGAPQPRFVFPDQNITFCRRVGTDHLKVTFCDESKNKVDAICFRAFSSPLSSKIENNLNKRFHIAGKLVKNTWRGHEKVQVIIDDAAEVQK